MKKLVILSFCVLSMLGLSKAQYTMDFGVQLGGANYLGEIGGSTGDAKPFLLDMKLSQTNVAAGGFFRYNFTANIGAKLMVNYARISGADSLSDEPTRVARNLSFRTDILEASLVGEYAFFVMNDISRGSRVDFRTGAYIGVGYILYYPEAQYQDSWYSLRPLATEGIENQYDEGSLIVPLGLNANFTFSKKLRLGLDIGYRFTYTDYLDDVSTDYAYDTELPFEESLIFSNRSAQAYERGDADLPHPGFYQPGSIRGNPDANDGYLTMQLTFSYVIDLGNSFYRSRYNSIINRRRKRTKF